jgi:anti-sigma B factor antagonist
LQFTTASIVTGFVQFPIVCTDKPAKIMIAQEFQLILLQPQQCLDVDGGKALETQLAGLMPQRQALWAIDLAKVDFMDSAGLVSLVTGLKAAKQSGCRLVLCNVQPSVRLVLELTRLDSIFEIFDSYDEVLTTINTPALVG